MRTAAGATSWTQVAVAGVVTVLAAVLVAIADPAPAGAGGSEAEPDTTPPEVFIRARKRQEFAEVMRKGVQATCGTDERPVECTMVVFRGQKSLDRETKEIVRPFNRARFYLEPRGAKRRRILRHGPPIELRLEIKVVDEAGNKSRDSKDVRLVRDT